MRSKGAPGGLRGPRQASPRALAIGGGIVVVVIVAIVLAVVLGKSGASGAGGADGQTVHIVAGTRRVGSSASSVLQGATDVATLFKGIPQNHFVLGSPSAPVQLVEFIDLQCPDCQQFETRQLPTLLQKYVRTGKLKIKMEPWSILDRTPDVTDSNRGQKSAIAAAAQNKAFQFAELLYDNQGTEETHWMTDQVISQIAAGVDGLDTRQFAADVNSSATTQLVHDVDSLANTLTARYPSTNDPYTGFTGTPGLFLQKGNGPLQLFYSGVPNLSNLESAIDTMAK